MSQDLLIKRLDQDMADVKREVSELRKETKDGFTYLGDKIDRQWENNLKTFVSKDEYNAFKEWLNKEKEASKWISGTWQMVIMLVIAVSWWVLNIVKSFTSK